MPTSIFYQRLVLGGVSFTVVMLLLSWIAAA